MWLGCSLFFSFHLWPHCCKCLFHLQAAFPFEVQGEASRPQGYAIFISIRKKKSIPGTSCRRRRLVFPWRLRESLWLGYTPISEPISSRVLGYCGFLGGHSGPLLGMDSIRSNTRTDSLTGSQRSRKWCWEVANQCLLLSFFHSLLLFLTFFPSLLYGKFCAQSRGYKHKKIFPALEGR